MFFWVLVFELVIRVLPESHSPCARHSALLIAPKSIRECIQCVQCQAARQALEARPQRKQATDLLCATNS